MVSPVSTFSPSPCSRREALISTSLWLDSMIPFSAAAFFVTYDYLKHNLSSPFPSNPSPLNHVLASSAGECVACLVRVPTEIVKSRMQTAAYGAEARSSLDAFRNVWRSEGLRGFYRGFGITIMREVSLSTVRSLVEIAWALLFRRYMF